MEDLKIKLAEWLPKDVIVMCSDDSIVWYKDGAVNGPYNRKEILKMITPTTE